MKTLSILTILCLTVYVLCSCTPVAKIEEVPKPAPPAEYKIGPSDVLDVFVWREEDLTQTITVDSRGSIFFPLLGELKVAGMTTSELASFLRKKLATYIKDPQVRVELKESRARRIIVMGEVARPGIYYLGKAHEALRIVGIERMGVLEAIMIAGGYSEDALLDHVKVVRGNLDKPEVLSVNVKRIFTKGERRRNILLESGDIVYVPRRLVADINYVIRQILPSLQTYVLTKDYVLEPAPSR